MHEADPRPAHLRLPHWGWLACGFLALLSLSLPAIGILSGRAFERSRLLLEDEVRRNTRLSGDEALSLVAGPCIALSDMSIASDGAREWEFAYASLDHTDILVLVMTFQDGSAQLRNVRWESHPLPWSPDEGWRY